eukprot:15203038-Alexandrium_andersonii.AAC.1
MTNDNHQQLSIMRHVASAAATPAASSTERAQRWTVSLVRKLPVVLARVALRGPCSGQAVRVWSRRCVVANM